MASPAVPECSPSEATAASQVYEDIQATKAEIASLELEFGTKGKVAQQLLRELQTLCQEKQFEVPDLINCIKERRMLAAQAYALDQQLTFVNEEIKEYHAEISELTAENARIQQKVQGNKAIVDRQWRTLREKDGQLLNLLIQNRTLQEKEDEYTQIADISNRIHRTMGEIARIRQFADDNRGQIHQLHGALAEMEFEFQQVVGRRNQKFQGAEMELPDVDSGCQEGGLEYVSE